LRAQVNTEQVLYGLKRLILFDAIGAPLKLPYRQFVKRKK